MNETNDAMWLAFGALAKSYPHDCGVRITADFARWLLKECQRAGLSAPPILQRVMHAVNHEFDAARRAQPLD